MFFIFNCLVEILTYTNFSTAIKKLHKISNYSTFYELFNLREDATLDEIEKAYKKYLINKTLLKHLNLKETARRELITDAYNILKMKREEYNAILNEFEYNSGRVVISKNISYFILLVISILTGLFAIDFIFNFKKIKINLSKKEKKSGEVIYIYSLKNLYCYRIFFNKFF